MKNIHLLPTDNPSRMQLSETGNYYLIDKIGFYGTSKPQNIYITSDESIKVNDYITDGYKAWKWKDDSSLLGRKKVILSTDQDLIADGVQPIDDKFLEWFVKNPNCKEIEINFRHIIPSWLTVTGKPLVWYEIIIPKEKPKQEEAQEQRMYSESDLKEAFDAGHKKGFSGYPNTENWKAPSFEQWFEQFKKK